MTDRLQLLLQKRRAAGLPLNGASLERMRQLMQSRKDACLPDGYLFANDDGWVSLHVDHDEVWTAHPSGDAYCQTYEAWQREQMRMPWRERLWAWLAKMGAA